MFCGRRFSVLAGISKEFSVKVAQKKRRWDSQGGIHGFGCSDVAYSIAEG